MLESFLSDFSYIKEALDKDGNHNLFGMNFSFFLTEPILFYNSEKDVIVYMNNNFIEEFNYSIEDLEEWKYSIYPMLSSEAQEGFRASMKSILEKEDVTIPDANYRLLAKNKKYSYYRVKVRKLHKSYYFIQLENSLKTIVPVFRNTTVDDLMNDAEVILKFGFWMSEKATNKLYWTKGVFKLLQYEDVEEVTPSFALLDNNIIKDESYLDFENRLKRGEVKNTYDIKYKLRTINNDIITISEHGRMEYDENGNILRITGLMRDITQLSEYENILENKISELNRSNTELEEFAYIASHDLQEPLRKISTFGHRLMSLFALQLGDEGLLNLEKMLNAAENMRNLIDNLLEFSRVSRSKQAFEEVNLSEIVQEAIEDLEMSISETGSAINTAPLPIIKAAPSQMRQLFFNLLHNSIKFRRKDTGLIIEILQKKLDIQEKKSFNLPVEKEYCLITIADNGIGFEQQYAEKIFQLFQRLEGKSEYPGTGIGLSICKKIVTNHKGLIFATSKPGVGTIFSIILPQH